MAAEQHSEGGVPRRLQRALAWVGAVGLLVVFVLFVYGLNRYFDDEPVTYRDDVEHFKYGSTGGERGYKNQFGFGIPYWIWVALPELFAEYLPDGVAGQGYAAFGMVYEDGRDPRYDLPIGMSMRRSQGVDRVYFNCAVCHTGVVTEPGSDRQIVYGMPANTFNLGALIEFLRQAGGDWRFRASRLMPVLNDLAERRDDEYAGNAEYRPEPFGWIDRQIFKLAGIAMMREQLSALIGRLSFMDFTQWGPGRVDTFNAPKALLGFDMGKAHERELTGYADFPSVWNQKARKGMSLHWDGNNCSVDERNLSAGFGTGATPATLDRENVLRVADWLWETAQPPDFPSQHVDQTLAARGGELYRSYCRDCHGEREAPYRDAEGITQVGLVTPIDEIGTDRWRLDSYTPELARAQSSLYAGHPADDEACAEYHELVCRADDDDERYRELRDRCYPGRFSHFRKTNGYANMPLDGIWLRAPYLHNGSVPNLRELLEPSSDRSRAFYVGHTDYDYQRVGFVTTGAAAAAEGWRMDTSRRGNGNEGHEGERYGTALPPADKDALVEYLKTF